VNALEQAAEIISCWSMVAQACSNKSVVLVEKYIYFINCIL